jgi:hypothetical protein
MEGGGGPVGPFANVIVAAVVILIVPASIVILIGLFHALMVWRVPRVRFLLIATILLPVIVTDLFGEPWTSVIAATYGLVVIFTALQGLASLRRATVS